jgi:hypothetical protein
LQKRALLVGARDDRPKYKVNPWPSLDVMRGLLEQLGGWTLEILEGLDADRDRMLAALSQLEARVEPQDTVLFYFFGHGGVVRFTDAPDELGLRPVFYVSAARRPTDTRRTGVLDVELSAFLGRMNRTCHNVTAILDCCHAAPIVRGKEIPQERAPSWVHALSAPIAFDQQETASGLVRLTATSAFHPAFPRKTATGQLGYLTEGLAAVIREAGFALDRLTWDAVMHRVREHAIQAKGFEEQWVTLSGPRSRLLFSREEAPLPRTVGFVASPDPHHGWLRAGLLQGVNVGDEWGAMALTLGAQKQPQILARMRVTECDLNRAAVEMLDRTDALPLASGSSALLQRATVRFPVTLDASAENLRQALKTSPLLRVDSPDEPALASVRATASGLVLRRETDGLEACPLCDEAQALSVLEDWGRSQLLVDVVKHCLWPATRRPVDLAWGSCEGERDLMLPPAGAELQEGQQVFFALSHAGLTPEAWYVCAIELDVAGRPILLNETEPDGLEIQPRQTIYLGRLHHKHRAGFQLRWPEQIPRDRSRLVTVLFLMSLRPLELGHLVQTPARLSVGASEPWSPPLRDADLISIPPAPSSKWAWTQLSYQLQPASLV